jgi:hypothetical protein
MDTLDQHVHPVYQLKILIENLKQHKNASPEQIKEINNILRTHPISCNFLVEVESNFFCKKVTAVRYLQEFQPAYFELRDYLRLRNSNDSKLLLRLTLQQSTSLQSLAATILGKYIII